MRRRVTRAQVPERPPRQRGCREPEMPKGWQRNLQPRKVGAIAGRPHMRAFHHRLLACVALLCWAAAAAAAQESDSARPKVPVTSLPRHWQPMFFFLAKGTAGACGAGCSEWIAAEGNIDADAPQRLRDFLAPLNGRDVPIFFNSGGGYMGQARELGRILRAHKISAGVGKTIPAGCRTAEATDESCRRLIASRREPSARLRTEGARCYSACVEAFIGASNRQVPADARLGVHGTYLESNGRAEKAPHDAGEYFERKRYVIEMGADPGLVDTAEQVRFDRLHVVTRQEIAKFGVETRGRYETPWMLDSNSPRWTLLKSVTQAKGWNEGPGDAEYRTGVVRVWCDSTPRIMFSYQRELRVSERDVIVRLGIGGRDFEPHGTEIGGELVVLQVFTDLEFFRSATSSDILITESFSPRDAQGWSDTTRLAATGLPALLDGWVNRCAHTKPADPNPAEVPRGGGGR
jgi:hypothetical protein